MDKKNRDRKLRIEQTQVALHHPEMDEYTADALLERATSLTYRAFGDDTTDDHIEWTFQRMVSNWRWGLSDFGVVTVH